MRSLMQAACFTLLSTPPVLIAQTPTDPPWSIAIGVGGSSLPDAFSTQCGSSINGGGFGGPTIGLAVAKRVLSNFVVSADTRITTETPLSGGCEAVLGDTRTVYDPRLRDPVITSSLYFGAETPAPLPLFRLSAGAGLLWNTRRGPVETVSLLWSTRGPRLRFFVDGSRSWLRVNATEYTGLITPPRTSRSIHESAGWGAVRIGLEFPLR